jgi:hypothetical protein
MKKIFYFLLFLFSTKHCLAQCNAIGTGLSATTIASPSNCPLNGAIAVSVTASTAGAPYTFKLSGSCLSTPITQSQNTTNYTFNSLQGNCTYVVCISDAGGNIISKTATVNNTYALLTGLTVVDSMYTNATCSKLLVSVAGGRAPYTYELFNGVAATGAPIQGPQVSNEFSNINADVFYTVRATDVCGQSIIAVKNTSSFKSKSISISDYALESCTSIREGVFLNDVYGGTEFQSNSNIEATAAGLKFPIIITAKNSVGALIAGYPYTLMPNVPAGWGLSTNSSLSTDLRWAPRIPNNAALFPITISYTDACGATASVVQPYHVEFSKAAYAIGNSPLLDTNVCPIKSCIKIAVGGNYIIGNSYAVSLYNNVAGTGSPLQTITYPAQDIFCGLDFNTTYYFKVHDPCLNKDTITSVSTGLPLPAFSVVINNCNTFCNGLSTSSFSYIGLFPNSVLAISGPPSSGPYPKVLIFTAGTNGNSGIGTISGLLAGTYNILFKNKCGESATSSLTVNEGNLIAQPVVTITPTGCASSAVKITPRVSATGQMLIYHTTPGCHSTAGVSYYSNIIFGQVSGGAPLPGSNNINVDNPSDGYTVNVTTPGTYVAIIAYSQGLPGINNSVSSCFQTVRDTFMVSFNTIPTIERVYTLPCSSGAYSIVPIAPNAVTGTMYTLYASNGTTLLAGPQVSNTFSNVNVSAGTSLIIKAVDPCGQSSTVPFSITSSTSISGTVGCLSIAPTSFANSLHADFINGASYTWTAPNGLVYTGNNPPLVIPSQAGVWSLSTTIQSGPCTAVLNNTFTTVACGVLPPPLNDTIKLSANTNACNVIVSWTTNAEVNSVRFDVEESADNINWRVVATKTAAGNSNTLRQYSVALTPNNSHVYYRIKLVNTSGQVKYSNTIEINILCPNVNILTNNNNPVSGNISLQFFSSVGRGSVLLIFVDAIGRQYLKKPVVVNNGINYYFFTPPQYLANGTYFVRLVAQDEVWYSNTIKVVLIR